MKVAGLGAAMAAPLLGAAKYFSSYGDQVAKMSKRTGMSVEALSELRYVASQTGTEFSSLVALTSIVPFAGVYLIEFSSRFVIISSIEN